MHINELSNKRYTEFLPRLEHVERRIVMPLRRLVLVYEARVQNVRVTRLCYFMYTCNSDRCKPVSVAWNNAKNSPHTTTYSDSQLRTLRNWVWLEVYILYRKFRSTNSVIMVDNDMYLKMNITSKALTFDLWCAVLPMLCRLLCIPCFVTKLNALSLC